VDGVELRNGRLRARLDGRRVIIDEFQLRGAGQAGQQGGGGLLTASGEGALTTEGPRVTLRARLDRLRASMREDRQLTVSGQVAAVLDASGVRVTGQVKVDQGLIVIPEEAAPRLGSDVVVRRPSGTVAAGPAPKVSEPAPAPARPLTVAVDVDLGTDFRVRGRGIDTRLSGTLAVSAADLANPRLTGTINTAGGEYRAYGQRLNVERGVIRFTGPLDNPALDILAIRPNLTQRVGVQVSGRAQAPFIRLYAEPDLSEAEKLSWLVLGRSSAAGGAEAALLQQAALALLAARTGGANGPGLASRFGLDELSFRRDGEGGPAVTLGRRFARNFYAAYERSLSGAVGTLFLFYELTQRFTVRAQAGERTAVDIIYTLSYD
jgi:translocation and assembly module TamB